MTVSKKTNAKTSHKVTAAQRATALASLPATAFLFQRGTDLLADTIRATGATKEAARAFTVGYLAGKWCPTTLTLTDEVVRDTVAIIDGASSTAATMNKGSTVRRTARQDADMAACRKAWQRFLEANSIAKTETRGAKSAKSKATRAAQMAGSSKAADAKPTDATAKMLNATDTKPAVPKFKGVGEANDWLARAAVQFRAAHDANVKVLSLVQREALLSAAKLFADAAKKGDEALARGKAAIERIKAA